MSVDEAVAWITASKPCVAGLEEGLMRTLMGDETVVKPLRGVLPIPWPFFAEVLVHNGPDQKEGNNALRLSCALICTVSDQRSIGMARMSPTLHVYLIEPERNGYRYDDLSLS